ncbi:ABC transporter substrate-binding protein [Corynebacterium sp.]|uniref:ABC transporter substrate-binding protein n=1 Tax=Corynebacterium sp. TaxID=1720 RepID=UPI0026DCD7BC|nr:ABC transporter substrate-binding protein [Corynebacterium sp.]MDO5031751.1 ABC transporter substrate-binding protein [Corynebacterium sp.]
MGARHPIRTLLALLLVAAVAVLSACGGEGESGAGKNSKRNAEAFGYMVNTRLATTNAGTSFGAATGAAQLSTRLYPAVYLPGPAGQIIPNSDLVLTEVLPANPEHPGLRVGYTLSEKARFSDGVPVTCDDFLLAFTAGVMSADFGSHLPLTQEITSFDCAPNSKTFTVSFSEDGGQRWRYLFGPGTVMPAHALARKAGMSMEELNDALSMQDSALLEEVAREWRYGFSTAAGEFDPELQVSYGPFVIDHIGDAGEVVLKANPEYDGDQPELDTIVVWPNTADAAELNRRGGLRVVDAASTSPQWFNRNAADNPFEVDDYVGALTETLTLSESGIFAQQWAREAFSHCVDQAKLAEISSRASGITVPPLYLRTLRQGDPLGERLASISQAHEKADPQAAADLAGSTIRIGYLGPDQRYAAMVAEIARTCEPVGITVVDESAEYMSQHYLEMDPVTAMPTVDAFLGPVDPLSEYPAPEPSISQLGAIRAREEALWEEIPSIPVAAQPRAFIVDRDVQGVVPYTGPAGIGWNMDRWSVGVS